MFTRRSRRRDNSQQEIDHMEEAADRNVITIEDSSNEESNIMTDTDTDVHMSKIPFDKSCPGLFYYDHSNSIRILDSYD